MAYFWTIFSVEVCGICFGSKTLHGIEAEASRRDVGILEERDDLEAERDGLLTRPVERVHMDRD